MKKENSRIINRTGEKHINNQGCSLVIIEYYNNENCTIQFDNGVIFKNIKYINIKKGNIKNPLHPSVYGVGFIGIGRYSEKTHFKIYKKWQAVLQRCYDKNHQEKYTTYKECVVTEIWHNFQTFAKWYENNYIEGYDLDKDILFKGNKIYSPETCCFVPHNINKLFTKRQNKRGECYIGVKKNFNKFETSLTKNSKSFYIGLFNTQEEAFQAYKKAKESYIKEVAEKYRGQVTEACYQALIKYQVEITD